MDRDAVGGVSESRRAESHGSKDSVVFYCKPERSQLST